MIDIVRRLYIDFGPTFANEKLREKHQLKLSTETLRQWMMAEGFWVSKRQARSEERRVGKEC